MPIPPLDRKHIERALERIRVEGVPRNRRGRGYCLVAENMHFAPKFVISLAVENACGTPLPPEEFSGGSETNRFLEDRDYRVVQCNCGGTGNRGRRAAPSAPVPSKTRAIKNHSACPEAIRTPSILRAAMVFPEVYGPTGAVSYKPVLPTFESFRGEDVDFVLFPEGHILSSDTKRIELLRGLAETLTATLLVGAGEQDSSGHDWQVLLLFAPNGSQTKVYTKHSSADTVAFQKENWTPQGALPTFELGGVTAGATICHDHYLGLLPRFLAKSGVRIWVNPSGENVLDMKWSSVLRLRAVENSIFALCTLHDNKTKRKTHPFAFSPSGCELSARKAGSGDKQLLSNCHTPGIYIIDLDMAEAGNPLEWSRIPVHTYTKRQSDPRLRKLVRFAMIDGQPSVFGHNGRWQNIGAGSRLEKDPVYVEVVKGKGILDPAVCFRVLEKAQEMKCNPIIWNHWNRFPANADSARLATLMKGRAIECCAPIVVSDRDVILELVELNSYRKVPVRREVKSGEASADYRFAKGLASAFKGVVFDTTSRPWKEMEERALNCYRSLR